MAQAAGWEANESWYYVMNKQQQGPASVDELAALYAKGKGSGITQDTLVWCASLVEWTRLKELSTLLALVQRPAPVAPQFPDIPKHVLRPEEQPHRTSIATSASPAAGGAWPASQWSYSCAHVCNISGASPAEPRSVHCGLRRSS